MVNIYDIAMHMMIITSFFNVTTAVLMNVEAAKGVKSNFV